jgi:hypothetical protein
MASWLLCLAFGGDFRTAAKSFGRKFVALIHPPLVAASLLVSIRVMQATLVFSRITLHAGMYTQETMERIVSSH